jgi:hypothetical protein
VGDRGLPRPEDPVRGRNHLGRAAAGPGDDPGDRLATPRSSPPCSVPTLRSWTWDGPNGCSPGAVARALVAGPRVHDPRLLRAATEGRRASPRPLGRWWGHKPAQRGPAVRPAPRDRPPEGLDRDRHHHRSHLASMTAQPHSPPMTGGCEACLRAYSSRGITIGA